MAKILVVEDDGDVAATIRTFLVFEKHTIEMIADGIEALEHLKTYPYDLIILDWQLPGMSGVDVCKEYRNWRGTTPILMLTGKNKIDEKEIGLNSGADDYLTKPFDLRELGARVRAILRRPQQMVSGNNIFSAGHIALDCTRHEATSNGAAIDLGPREFQLLEFLLRHPNQVYTHEALLNHVWSAQSEATEEALRTAMKRLRKKIDPDSLVIKNVHGVGYILETSKSG
ncbi:MAG TPA: response regulator transcription factor [Oculatellaceae cyanobacterium]